MFPRDINLQDLQRAQRIVKDLRQQYNVETTAKLLGIKKQYVILTEYLTRRVDGEAYMTPSAAILQILEWKL